MVDKLKRLGTSFVMLITMPLWFYLRDDMVNKLKKLKIISALLVVFVAMPIWFYLMYSILDSIGASGLMWFLFWVYFPILIFGALVGDLDLDLD